MSNHPAQPRISQRTLQVACLAATALVFAVFGCSDPPQPVPGELLGTWRSSNERYRDRTFEIRQDVILFGTGEFKPAALHSIVTTEAIEPPGAAGTRRWRVVYRDAADGTDSVELVYRATPKRGLRFANREDWWFPATKEESDE